ncbi:MAG: sodium:solute symporter, partial [Flavobacteriales bacterium]|nr:sodium:solute symporter [Flavobacteriales bacterium]
YSKIFFFEDCNHPKYFWKQFAAGAAISIVMTGLDQDMMQKNLSCRNIGEAQKNMFSFSIVLVIVNLFFLALGALLYLFANSKGMDLPPKADDLYPIIATGGELPIIVGVLFILGLIAAAYSSADSALAALTTSACVDILDVEKKSENEQIKLRKKVHIIMSGILVLTIMVFRWINDDSIISALFRVAGYTYGPLLGLYAFGMFSKRKIKDKLAPIICFLSPVLCYIINLNSETWLNGYKFGFELLILNGVITFMGLLLISSGNKVSVNDIVH